MDLTITKSNVQDVDVAVNSTSVTVQQSNSLLVEVTPQQRIEINLDRTVTGNGIPSGGTTGQVLAKASNDNYDAEWETLGTMSAQDADNVAITGGSITGITDLSVNDGGTGASTASGARANLSAAMLGANTDITSLAGITGGIETADYLQLDSLATPTIGLAKLRWNADTATAAFGIVDGTDEVNIGEQMFAYVTNAESVAITRGQAVYLYQAQGNRATVKLASNLGDATSAKTLGLVAQDSIGANQTGFVITQGVVSKINTSGFAEGATLYLGETAGSLTATKPKAPNHLVYIGVVERANAGNGQIYVRPQNGYELDEIHDVQINSPVNGQTIIYDQSTSLWKNANLTAGTGVTIVNGNGTITISAPDNGTVTNVTGTAPISVATGTTTPVVSMTQASGSTNGWLSSTDWTTFNNKGSGTVTSVSGTGSVSGITLSGTVTSSGSLTLGGSLDLSSPPAIGNTTPNTGAFTTLESTGQADLGTSSTNYISLRGASGAPTIRTVSASTAGLGLSSSGSGAINFYTNSVLQEQLRVAHTASAVNYVQVTGAATGNKPTISAQGSDTNINLDINSKGNGNVTFNSGTSPIFRMAGSASTANYLQVIGSPTNQEPVLSAQGSDTNINFTLQSKGTGSIDLASGSTGVNVSNGTTVTAITRTAAGTNYTSSPSVAISAPNISGGVQATATVTIGLVGINSIGSGGTGYSVNDVLTISGGTFTVACQVTVTAVSAGVITAVSITTGGSYTVAPTNPASVTGGTGTGATFNLSFGISTAFTITNAGSGYTAQPTVTFSGGGGSGASAYATVGSGTFARSLGSSLQFQTPGGTQFAVSDGGVTSGAYWQAVGGVGTADLRTAGAGVLQGAISTQSAVPISFRTNFSEQMRVSHTASAVNYVQVTGAVTTGIPLILAQGSDTNVSVALASKAGGYVSFRTNTSVEQVRVYNTASAVNRIEMTGSATGSAPLIAVAGNDTNIDLTLTPKGTGLVRFGTRTATADTAITGYIEIKDAGGTIRRLAVIN